MKFKRSYLKYVGLIFPMLLALACLLQASMGSYQSSHPIPMPQSLIGEYSYDRENWLPITDDADLSALKGDLYLRGHFEMEMPEGQLLRFYRDHIGMSISINGELEFIDAVMEMSGMGKRLFASMCGQNWEVFRSPGISAEDEIEIHLYNPHRLGNESAYRCFLKTLCGDVQGEDFVARSLAKYGAPFRVLGGLFAMVSLMLLGAAVAALIVRVAVFGKLLKLSMLTVFAGGFILFDTVDISCWNELIAMNTYGKQLCAMLSVYFVGEFVYDFLSGKRRTAARIALNLSFVLNTVLTLAALLGLTAIYDTLPVWVASQMLFCPLFIVCCIMELYSSSDVKWLVPVSGAMLFGCVLLDLFGLCRNMLISNPWSKLMFCLLFVVYVVNAGCGIVVNHRASIRAEKLEKELEDSRISIMLSQIQPHFLYNVLGTIRGLCLEDPMQARRALGDFSDYLRGNMSALANSNTIYFSSEFRHIEAYLRLEKMRMGGKLNILYDIQEKDFFIPPLTVQPLVENAVKHGLFEKGGGTLILHTHREEGQIVVSVQDDGVGFDENAPLQQDEHHAHIGLANVRSRLEKICGGRMVIDSAPGRGTTVNVYLRTDTNGNGGMG